MNPHRTRRRAVRSADGLALITATPPAPHGPDVRARRGDLALIVAAFREPGTTEVARTEIELAEITNVTRDGQVAAVRPALWPTVARLTRWPALQQVYLLPRDQIRVAAALDTARSHTRDGHPAPYPDLDAARATLRPHLVCPGDTAPAPKGS